MIMIIPAPIQTSGSELVMWTYGIGFIGIVLMIIFFIAQDWIEEKKERKERAMREEKSREVKRLCNEYMQEMFIASINEYSRNHEHK